MNEPHYSFTFRKKNGDSRKSKCLLKGVKLPSIPRGFHMGLRSPGWLQGLWVSYRQKTLGTGSPHQSLRPLALSKGTQPKCVCVGGGEAVAL